MSELKSTELIESLGYKTEDFKTIEEFRDKVGADWIKKANAEKDPDIQKAIIGTFSNRIEKAVMNGAKEFGISLTDDDFKDAKYTDDRVKVAINKMKDHFSNTTGDLKKQVDTKGKEFATELQSKLDRLQSDYEVMKGENEKLNASVIEKDKWAKDQVKMFQINDAKSKAKEKTNGIWKDNPSQFEKIGFEKTIEDKYDTDFDEKEGLIVFERATKKRIANPAVVNTFMTYDQVIEMELKAAGLDKKNPHGGEKKPVNPFAGQGGNNSQGGERKKIPVNPAFFNKG